MSVEIKVRKDFKAMGRLIVKTQDSTLGWEDVKNRVDSLIDAIWSMDENLMTKQTIYPLLEILKDYLPTDEQWKKIFEEEE